VAVYGSWDGKSDWWRGWAPVPKTPAQSKDNE